MGSGHYESPCSKDIALWLQRLSIQLQHSQCCCCFICYERQLKVCTRVCLKLVSDMLMTLMAYAGTFVTDMITSYFFTRHSYYCRITYSLPVLLWTSRLLLNESDDCSVSLSLPILFPILITSTGS